MLSGQIARTINIAEGTIAHLFQELPSVQIRVFRELSLAGVFFSDNLSQVGLVYPSALGTISLSRLDMVGCGIACLSGSVLLIVGSF